MNAQNDFLDNAVNDGLDMEQGENMQSQMCSFMNDDTAENCSLLQSDTCGDGRSAGEKSPVNQRISPF